MNRNIVVALMLVAAMAFAADGRDCGTVRVESRGVSHFYCAWKVGVGGAFDVSIDLLGEYGAPYVININKPDTVEAIYIEGREVSMVEEPDLIATFIAGALAGLFVALVCGW